MVDPLDYIEKEENIKLADPAKVLNSVLLFLPFIVILFAIWSVWNTKTVSSPWLPEYSAYYVNGILINFTIVQSIGILPAFFFRLTKKYILSSSCIILFFLLAIVLKYNLNLHLNVYMLLN